MKVLVTETLAESGLERLRGAAEVDVKLGLSPEELVNCIGEYHALIVRSATKATASVIEAGANLKVIGRAGAGVDNIDVDAATAQGVVVVNVPDGNTIAAAEHTMGLILAVCRNIPQANVSLKGGEWKRNKFMGVELYGKVLGVVGLGRIGFEVSKRAKSFGMKVLGYDPYVTQERAEAAGVELAPLAQLLERADVLTVHVPLTKETRGLIGARELAMMKPTARVVNCARGGIIDEGALYSALKEGKLGGAALDVFENEPVTSHPLFELDNVVVTPHLGSATVEAQEYNALQVAEQVIQVLKGEPILSAVNLPNAPPEEWKAIAPFRPLAEILGRFYTQALPGRIKHVEVRYSGEVAEHHTALLTNTLLKGLFRGVLAENVNFINAPAVAKKRGIRVTETKLKGRADYPSLINLAVETERGVRSVAGTLTSTGEARIVEVDGYHMDVAPSEHMLLVYHIDRPGMIGRIGTLLGANEINIAGMQVGRRTRRGEAVMLLLVDEGIPDAILEEISKVDGVLEARRIELH